MSTAPTTTPPTTPVPDARRVRIARWIISGVIVAATALAFSVALLTEDNALGQRQRRARAQIRRLNNIMIGYMRGVGTYPSEAESFQPLIEGKVLESVPTDPWGNPYRYRVLPSGKGEVYSLGADDAPGGEGEAADLTGGGATDTSRAGGSTQR